MLFSQRGFFFSLFLKNNVVCDKRIRENRGSIYLGKKRKENHALSWLIDLSQSSKKIFKV